MTMPFKERRTADALVAAFNAMDVDTIIASHAPAYKRVLLPSSLKHSEQNNDMDRANLMGMKDVFASSGHCHGRHPGQVARDWDEKDRDVCNCARDHARWRIQQ
jgi:hypothetical protein